MGKFLDRREFIFSLIAVVGSACAWRPASAWADGSLPAGATAVSETDPMASALGYKQQAKNADSTKYPQLKQAAGKQQKCENCNFYKKENGAWGKCQLFQSGLVNAQGWCASWIKKA